MFSCFHFLRFRFIFFFKYLKNRTQNERKNTTKAISSRVEGGTRRGTDASQTGSNDLPRLPLPGAAVEGPAGPGDAETEGSSTEPPPPPPVAAALAAARPTAPPCAAAAAALLRAWPRGMSAISLCRQTNSDDRAAAAKHPAFTSHHPPPRGKPRTAQQAAKCKA